LVDSSLEFENFSKSFISNLHIFSKNCMKTIGFRFKRMQTFLAKMCEYKNFIMLSVNHNFDLKLCRHV
jgi:hypothetical protein